MLKFSPALLLFAATLFAQPPAPALTYQQSWPAADPSFFEITIQPTGTAHYRSVAHQQANSTQPPDPFDLDFTLSPQSTQRVFSLAPNLARFQPTLDKIKVAFTGAKTLRYQPAAGAPLVLSYNYSASPELTDLTELLRAISESIELSETLRTQLRFDKFSLDATLKRAEELAALRRFPELQLLQPILTRIANDPAVMNIARQRARRLLQIQPSAKPK